MAPNIIDMKYAPRTVPAVRSELYSPPYKRPVNTPIPRSPSVHSAPANESSRSYSNGIGTPLASWAIPSDATVWSVNAG